MKAVKYADKIVSVIIQNVHKQTHRFVYLYICKSVRPSVYSHSHPSISIYNHIYTALNVLTFKPKDIYAFIFICRRRNALQEEDERDKLRGM